MKEKVKFFGRIIKLVTYQDPCFLGKHSNIYDEPRKIIENVPGIKFLELSMSRTHSVYCEGGGVRMGERLAEKSVKEAINTGTETLAVVCPFCLFTFDDAIKTMGNEDRISTWASWNWSLKHFNSVNTVGRLIRVFQASFRLQAC